MWIGYNSGAWCILPATEVTCVTQPVRLCFVCLGNIIRSPLAEALFWHYAEQRGVAHKYEVDSAGTGAWHIGEPPDPRIRRVAARHGLHYDHRGRQIHPDDFDRFDWFFVMDDDTYAHMMALASLRGQGHKVRYLREFDPQAHGEREVPDPYYGGEDGFELVYRVIDRSVQGLLEALESGQLSSEQEA
ncbi:MAG TPA: low molecular weight phosphotyrosine protein phosphatase [Anaerolineaceae bacterium]|nr:low molecular weight phosphotyrosine protein phosphatase [Anaerolineales bacterium]HIQ09081.1 low molecular weight phosphotyrosine protein phosphatase [Anaerolineaceae bacterium]